MKTFFVLAQNYHLTVYPDIGYPHRIHLPKIFINLNSL